MELLRAALESLSVKCNSSDLDFVDHKPVELLRELYFQDHMREFVSSDHKEPSFEIESSRLELKFDSTPGGGRCGYPLSVYVAPRVIRGDTGRIYLLNRPYGHFPYPRRLDRRNDALMMSTTFKNGE